MLKKDALQEWEQAQISTLTLKLIFAATGGTLAATAIAYLLKAVGIGEIKPELLFAPWGIALVTGVSLAFRKGVMAERERAAAAADKK